MQPVPNKAKIGNTETQFDFLNVDENRPASESANSVQQQRARRRRPESVSNSMKSSKSSKQFPVIRKPVSVAQTGPLRPPRPGDPVEPPPPLTDGFHASPDKVARPKKPDADLDDLNFDLDNDVWPTSDHWADNLNRTQATYYDEPGISGWRKLGYFVAALLILAGAGAALYSNPPVRQWADVQIARLMDSELMGRVTAMVDKNSATSSERTLAETASPEAVGSVSDGASNQEGAVAVFEPDAPALEGPATPAAVPSGSDAPRSLNVQFREALAGLEVLLEQGNLEEATSVLQTMDRAVYGYGAPEFTEIKERIAALSQNANAEQAALQQAQLAEQQRAEEQARAAEEQRLAAEQARAVEEQRLAAENQRRAEAEAALAAEQALERERNAATAQQLENQRAEQEREDAAALQLRTDRLAQEQARQEQLALARQERELLEQQQRAAQLPQVAVADGAQDPVQGNAAPGQTVDLAGTALEVDTGFEVSLAETPDTQFEGQTQQPTARAISDSDLQQVYGQFSQLERAIEGRDVNAVIQLTERSGARIQQIMQMFENNVSIEAQLQNVSTLDARSEIQGTLQITRLVRADGSVTGPPLNLASVRLSSVRTGDEWSSIRW